MKIWQFVTGAEYEGSSATLYTNKDAALAHLMAYISDDPDMKPYKDDDCHFSDQWGNYAFIEEVEVKDSFIP